jgi:hypothetical protein
VASCARASRIRSVRQFVLVTLRCEL